MDLIINDLINIIRQTYEGEEEKLKEIACEIVKNLEDGLDEAKIDNCKVSYRIKGISSLSEKIIRNKYLLSLEESDLSNLDIACIKILNRQTDLVGIKIQCRFIRDERIVFASIKNLFDENGICKNDSRLSLELDKKQPQEQANGFDIYRIDGAFNYSDQRTYKFELQIKSLVNSFWGDVEHEIIYKNSNVSFDDPALFNELMKTIYHNLHTIDRQLVRMHENLTKKANFDSDVKKIMENIIYSFFHEQIISDFNININIKHICTLISEYYYSKSKYKNTNNIATIIGELINAVNGLDISSMNFIEEKSIAVTSFPNTLYKALFEIMYNKKHVIPEWNILLKLLTAISNDSEESVINSYLTEIYRKIDLAEVYAPLEDIEGIDSDKIKEGLINNILTSMEQESAISVFLDSSINNMLKITESFIGTITDIENINFENSEDDNIIEVHKFLMKFSYKDRLKANLLRADLDKLNDITWVSIDETCIKDGYLRYEHIYKLIQF